MLIAEALMVHYYPFDKDISLPATILSEPEPASGKHYRYCGRNKKGSGTKKPERDIAELNHLISSHYVSGLTYCRLIRDT